MSCHVIKFWPIRKFRAFLLPLNLSKQSAVCTAERQPVSVFEVDGQVAPRPGSADGLLQLFRFFGTVTLVASVLFGWRASLLCAAAAWLFLFHGHADDLGSSQLVDFASICTHLGCCQSRAVLPTAVCKPSE